MIVGVVNDDGSAVYWYDVPPAQIGSLRAAGDGRLVAGYDNSNVPVLGYYSSDVYNYQTDGNPGDYKGSSYGNFRGYGNTSGYNSSSGYISRAGYQGGWSRRY